jgi:5S rRNA maturation endonuclease (ribonuclease M5)
MMFDIVQQEVLALLPAKQKHTNKWISFNAPCCTHRGETQDRRGRGGVAPNADGSISYHCFNCHFKTNYRPGRAIGYKFKQLLEWLGASDRTIQRLSIEALRIRDLIAPPEVVEKKIQEIRFEPRPLPEGVVSLSEFRELLVNADEEIEIPEELARGLEYLSERRINLDKYEFYFTDDTAHKMNKRIIIPFIWKQDIIGYTSRTWDENVKPKYFNSHEPNFVFNTNMQTPDRKFVIVVEGPFDAMAIDGVAILGNEISEEQVDIIDSLKREVIVVPDWDKPGQSMIDAALEYGWSVSFPVWREEYKDVASAVEKLGRLFVLKSILEAKQSNGLKIELLRKKIYN